MSFTRKATYAPAPATSRGQAVQLSGDPKGVNFIYTCGRSVIIRNLANPAIATEYTGHSTQTTVARYSPSGFYIASADISGNVRIWDTINAENILKTETRVFGGRVNDLCWDHESKRIIAVGEGKDKFGHAFAFDTASSVGEISGHSKAINSVSIRQDRPMKAVTASDDLTVNFYNGVPYKFGKSITDHTRFVQAVRFSPNGEFFASAGMDSKVFLYDGKTGDKIAELSSAANSHTGGIFALSWSPDSKHVLTSSADMTAKLWDVGSKSVVNTYAFSGSGVDDQQVGNLWQGEHMISLSLSGDLNYLDKSSSKPLRVVKGHQKGITALEVASDKTLYSGSYDGRVYSWVEGAGSGTSLSGSGHSNQVSAMSADGGKIISVGMDDSVRSIDVSGKSFDGAVLATGSVPKDVAAHGDYAVVATVKDVIVTKSGTKVSSLTTNYTPGSVAISPDGSEVSVGGDDCKVYVYHNSSGTLTQKHVLDSNRGAITALAYSPDGSMLAAGDSDRKVLVYDVKSKSLKLNEWVFHNAKVNCISWSPDGLHAASGSLDTNVEVWSVDNPMKHISIKGAHTESVNGVVWLDNNTIASAGQDAMIKMYLEMLEITIP
ncbi:hypothetical protein SmJEL517_g03113 [Synchytrium microbalum]|uniref:Uncharacterized protein n=1 Tax=Synchytrium microbalum TaxID=1806994 RepID=A0A507C9F7_9FUNG|nr:uncharacterized protein SmJEL517_g03113 [Synchytrium microbalum]TPX34145.1 hypothetical protein SmJEL517_g03113 [Synchytrium microbalum]